jgi:predicted MFS family arabinose efflux permease
MIWFFKKPVENVSEIDFESNSGTIRAGLSHLRSKPDSLIALASVFILAFFAMHFPTTIALMSRDEFRLDIRFFGVLSSSIALGYVFGGVLMARRNSSITLESLMKNVIIFSIILTITAISPTVQIFAVLVFFCGTAGSNMVGSFNAYVQENCNIVYRGRVLGVYLSCFTAGTTFGVLLVGLEAQVFGPRFPLYVGAATSMLLAVVVLRYKNRIRDRLQIESS